MKKRPTLAQVALAAGVSKTTASYVLSGQKKMAEDTVRRVQAAAHGLGYRPDSSATRLRRGRSPVVGVLTTDLASHRILGRNGLFWPRFIDSFITEASEHGMVVAFASEEKLQLLLDAGVDALLIMGIHSEDFLAEIKFPFGLPILSQVPIKTISSTVLAHDPTLACADLANHFTEAGAKQVTMLCREVAYPVFLGWDNGLAQACADRGIAYDCRFHDGSLAGITDSVTMAIEAGADGIFSVSGDSPALMDGIRAAKKQTPRDVLLVVQGEGLIEAAMTPSISTLSLEAQECGRIAAGVCQHLIAGKKMRRPEFPVRLTIRESSRR